MLDDLDNELVDTKAIYDSMIDKMNYLYTNYYSFFMKKEKFDKFLYNEIDKTKYKVNNLSGFDKYIENRLIHMSIAKVKEFLNDEASSRKIIDNYIKLNFVNITDMKSARRCLTRFDVFLSAHDYLLPYPVLL